MAAAWSTEACMGSTMRREGKFNPKESGVLHPEAPQPPLQPTLLTSDTELLGSQRDLGPTGIPDWASQ